MNKVLIVDDSATARLFTRRCLTVAGLDDVEFVELESAVLAEPRLLDPEVSLMIVDLVMPKMTGRELLERHRKVGAKFPVIVVSSAVNHAEEVELLAAGARAVVKKPLNPATAAAALELVRGRP